jgi:hypothetical protein
LFLLNRLLLLLIIAAVVLVLYLALTRFLSSRQLAPVSEEAGAGRAAQAQRAGWGARLLRRFTRWQQRRAAASIRRIYYQMSRAAAAQGFGRGDSETPYEYLTTLAQAWPNGTREAELITRAYVRVRYGELPESEEEVVEVREAWERLEAIAPPE